MAEERKEIINGAKKYKDFIFAVGRRRAAVARVRLYEKIPSDLKFGESEVTKGKTYVNEKDISDYFKSVSSRVLFEKPLKLTDTLNKYTITAKIAGGGTKSQVEAFVLGLSRALSALDEKNRPILRKNGLLTRDARVRERRKVGMGGKARRKRQSPKR